MDCKTNICTNELLNCYYVSGYWFYMTAFIDDEKEDEKEEKES